jgi:hypothetical protein
LSEKSWDVSAAMAFLYRCAPGDQIGPVPRGTSWVLTGCFAGGAEFEAPKFLHMKVQGVGSNITSAAAMEKFNVFFSSGVSLLSLVGAFGIPSCS